MEKNKILRMNLHQSQTIETKTRKKWLMLWRHWKWRLIQTNVKPFMTSTEQILYSRNQILDLAPLLWLVSPQEEKG